jgi:hypothetical protein
LDFGKGPAFWNAFAACSLGERWLCNVQAIVKAAK